jgi:dihydroorotate dehydrogenase (fumarate)
MTFSSTATSSTADLTTEYLGLRLGHPIVASASPLTGHLDSLAALEAAGAAAVVLPSLFEEDAEREMSFAFVASGATAVMHAEAATGLPVSVASLDVAQRHAQLVADAKSTLRIPVIASVNGTSATGWVRHAAQLADAGADAIELNVYRVSADPTITGSEIEDAIVALVDAVRAEIKIPLAVKIGPYFTALPTFGQRLASTGANAIVLFNRFYQPDIDLEELVVHPSLDLSTSVDLRLPLRWTAILKDHVNAQLALSGGVHQPTDVVKALLVGATAVMTTSALLRHGPGHITVLRNGLSEWLHEKGYRSVSQMRGSMAVGHVPDPDTYERANYLRVIQEASRDFGRRQYASQ